MASEASCSGLSADSLIQVKLDPPNAKVNLSSPFSGIVVSNSPDESTVLVKAYPALVEEMEIPYDRILEFQGEFITNETVNGHELANKHKDIVKQEVVETEKLSKRVPILSSTESKRSVRSKSVQAEDFTVTGLSSTIVDKKIEEANGCDIPKKFVTEVVLDSFQMHLPC